MGDFTLTDTKRITFLSIFKTLSEGNQVVVPASLYEAANSVVEMMIEGGYFDTVSSAPIVGEVHAVNPTQPAATETSTPSISPQPVPSLPSSSPIPTLSSEFVPQKLQEGWIDTSEACPDCLAAGRAGTIRRGPVDGKKPVAACSLRKRRKHGEAWINAGLCDYIEWSPRD